jgi:hypothetical protein
MRYSSNAQEYERIMLWPWGIRWLAHKAENLTTICELIVYKMFEPQRLTTLWASIACYRDNFTFFIYIMSSEVL